MAFDFDTPISRQNTGCCKWDDLQQVFGRTDVLPLWVADMDFSAPPGVTAALKARLEHPVYGYHTREKPLFESVANWEKKRHGWQVELEWLMNAPGVVPSISAAILAFTEPGDEIIIQPPVYPPFSACVKNNNRRLVENPLIEDSGRYTPDLEDLKRKITPRTKLLILCSPHNPVGRVWTRDELLTLNEICLNHGVTVISDEIHCDLAFSGHRHIPTAALGEAIARNTVAMISPSKTFNIAGTYTSFVVIPDAGKRRKFAQTIEALKIGAGNLFGIIAAEAAYRTGEAWLDELLPYLEANAGYLAEYVRQNLPGVKVVKPEGTYLAWLDFRGVSGDPAYLQGLLLNRAKVGLNDGAAYGHGGAGFARLNFACSRSLLQEGLVRIEQALKNR